MSIEDYNQKMLRELFPQVEWVGDINRTKADHDLICHLVNSLVEAQAKIENLMALPHQCCTDDCYFDERPLYDLFHWIEGINGDL